MGRMDEVGSALRVGLDLPADRNALGPQGVVLLCLGDCELCFCDVYRDLPDRHDQARGRAEGVEVVVYCPRRRHEKLSHSGTARNTAGTVAAEVNAAVVVVGAGRNSCHSSVQHWGLAQMAAHNCFVRFRRMRSEAALAGVDRAYTPHPVRCSSSHSGSCLTRDNRFLPDRCELDRACTVYSDKPAPQLIASIWNLPASCRTPHPMV